MSTETEIIECLKKKFIVPDNIPEDLQQRHNICMEARASILIDSYCTTGRFAPFMKSGRHEIGKWVYPLAKPFEGECKKAILDPMSGTLVEQIHYWKFPEFEVLTGEIPIADECKQIGRWRLHIPEKIWKCCTNIALDSNPLDAVRQLYENELTQFQKDFHLSNSSKFKLCQPITPYKTPERVCRFFDNEGLPFAPLKLSGTSMRQDAFQTLNCDADSWLNNLKQNYPDKQESDLINRILARIVVWSLENYPIMPEYEKCFDNWLKFIFTFKNIYGEPIMKVANLYDFEEGCKIRIPITCWMQNFSTENQISCVPCSGLQPLFNLDLLAKTKEPIVIITDNIEIAGMNQQNTPDGIVFTSFLCDPGKYDQVDFAPLKKASEIYYLVTNHSGGTLESAYLKANEFLTFWQGSKDCSELKLKFIQLKVDYPFEKPPQNIAAILRQRAEHKPEVNPASIEVMEEDAFAEQYQKALTAISAKPVEWWESQPGNTEEKRIVTAENDKRKPMNYLLRPLLLYGEASMLYSGKSTGKSALGLSIAAALTSSLERNLLLPEKWWTLPYNKNEPRMKKVLYLDFENGSEDMKGRKTSFCIPYWPEDKEKRAFCEANLIIKDMTGKNVPKVNFAEPSNHQKIYDYIEWAKTQGCKDQPVDLLVIDTYPKFVQDENTTIQKNFSDLINGIRNMGLSILILHQANSLKEIRGRKSVLDDLYMTMLLYREEKNRVAHTLDDFMIFEYKPSRNGMEKLEPFQLFKPKEKWQVYHSDDGEEVSEEVKKERMNTEFKAIVGNYENRNFDNPAIQTMIGMDRSGYFARKKECELT